jgi:heme-degrading monooxygenase HmoA
MTETYSSGLWTVKSGEEDAFVEAWKEFVTWAAEMPGSGTFRLIRDLDQPNRFLSFGSWQSQESQNAWIEQSEFAERRSGWAAFALTATSSRRPHTSSRQRFSKPVPRGTEERCTRHS